MNVTLDPGARRGSVTPPASKSQAHRLLICAALGQEETRLRCDGFSKDIQATAACLRGLGAEVAQSGDELLITPIRPGRGSGILPCSESGSTLRFLLPLAGVLGLEAEFRMEGQLPHRPLHPLWELLEAGGMTLRQEGDRLFCRGKLHSGDYALPGNVSSQFISGLLLALPLAEGDSTLQVTTPLESADYVAMTEEALRLSGIRWEGEGLRYRIPGCQRPALPPEVTVEKDWSAAAFFLSMGALSPAGITVRGMDEGSRQGDRRILALLERFGAEIIRGETGITVRRSALRGCRIDASQIPDLVPVLSTVAAAAEGETRIVRAQRLRLKESDRLRTTAAMLRSLGAEAEETEDGLRIPGRGSLPGGTADAAGDHRIAMSAAVAASAARSSVTVLGAQCAEKSYPRFWEDLEKLEVLP